MPKTLDELRVAIDSVDARLLELLAERQAVVREIGTLKKERQLPIVQPERAKAMFELRMSQGETLGLDRSFVAEIWHALHEESVRQQERLQS